MKKHVPLVIGMSLGLVACGGGGGGGGSSDPVSGVKNDVTYSGSETPVAISDQTSADNLVSKVFGADGTVGDMPDLSQMMMKPGQTDGTSAFDAASFYSGIKANFSSLASSGGTLAGVTDSGTDQCDFGGTISGSITYASQDHMSAGDTMDVTFSNCGMGQYETWNGRVVLYVRSVSGNPGDPNVDSSSEISVAFVDVNMADDYNGTSMLMDGSMTVGEKYVAGTSSTTSTLKGSRFRFAVTGTGADEDMLMSNFDLAETTDYSAYVHTSDVNWSLTTTSLGGTVTVDTLTPFKQDMSALYPHEGVMVISGADGANVKLTVSLDTFTVEYDLNGDGVYGPADGTDPAPRTGTWGVDTL